MDKLVNAIHYFGALREVFLLNGFLLNCLIQLLAVSGVYLLLIPLTSFCIPLVPLTFYLWLSFLRVTCLTIGFYLQYVHIDHKTDMADMDKAMKVLKEEWKMEAPNVLISVTGDAKIQQTHPGVKDMLSRLVEVAHNTGIHLDIVGNG